MKKLLGFLLLTGILSLPGCYPAFVFEMEGLEPAELTVSGSISTLGVMSRLDLDSLWKIETIRLRKNSTFVLDSSIAKEAVKGCIDELIESPRFEVYDPIVMRNLVGEFSDPGRPLPWASIWQAAGDPPLDAILSLEHFTYKDTVISSSVEYWVVHTYRLICETHWRLYDLKSLQSRRVVFADTTTIDLGPETRLNQSAAEKTELVKERMYWAGRNTGRRFAPYWTELDRIYFPYGPGDFYKGARYMRDGNWTEAAAVWNQYVEMRSKSVRSKAYYNMAVTCELAGDLQLAQEWLDKAKQLGMPEYYIKDYSEKLKERAEKLQSLNQQMLQEALPDE